jgi:putative DNA primase/helicase
MTRRALLVQLDPAIERPELRVFEEPDLVGYITRERQSLLAALFTILKAYQLAGRPDCNKKPLGRFEQWCAAVCGPIRWLGYPDPLESQERLRAQDPEAEKLELLLFAWHTQVGNNWKTAADIIDATSEQFNSIATASQRSTLQEALIEAAPDGGGRINRHKLGWFLKHFTGRVAGGYRLEKRPRVSTRSKNAQQYRVVELDAEGGDE